MWGEVYAARYLRDKGCTILTANYSSRFGEIDIVAENGKNLLFVEVKTRKENYMFSPAEAVDDYKRERLILAAESFIKTGISSLQPRFDVAEIILDENFGLVSVNYIENAFGDML